MVMEGQTAAVTSSGARATAPISGFGDRFALAEEFLNVKSVSDPQSPNMEDASSRGWPS